jgi:hypothetical protein
MRALVTSCYLSLALLGPFPRASAASEAADDECPGATTRDGSEAFIPRPTLIGDTTVVLQVCLTHRDGEPPIGSYHLELSYDSTAGHVVSVHMPSDGMRVNNAERPGKVSLAGASPTGFGNGAVAAVTLRLKLIGSDLLPRLAALEVHSVASQVVVPRVWVYRIGSPAEDRSRAISPVRDDRIGTCPNAMPTIVRVDPKSLLRTKQRGAHIRISGCGFSAQGNTVLIGPLSITGLRSKNGTLIDVILPRPRPQSRGIPATILSRGANSITVKNASGTSNSSIIVIR